MYIHINTYLQQAGIDLTKHGNRFIMRGKHGSEIVPATKRTDAVLGVLLNRPEQGDTAEVQPLVGLAHIVASGPIKFGDPITAAEGGKATVAMRTPINSEPTRVHGFAFTEAREDGDLIDILLSPSHI